MYIKTHNFKLNDDNKVVYIHKGKQQIMTVPHKTVLLLAELSFNDWCKYFTVYNKRKNYLTDNLKTNNNKNHKIITKKAKPHPCDICFTPLSSNEIAQNKNKCSDCRNEL